MISHFKSAMDKIKAEDELVRSTEAFLKNELGKSGCYNESRHFSWKKFNKRKMAAAFCMMFLLAIGGIGGHKYYYTPAAYLSLDINPSIELALNSFNKVIVIENCNGDGEKLIEGKDLAGSDVEAAIKILVLSAINNGFVAEDGSTIVSITAETNDYNAAQRYGLEAEKGALEALKESGKAALIRTDAVSLSIREEAKSLGITPGKLNLINELKSIDSTATVEKYKDKSIKDIVTSIKDNNSGKFTEKTVEDKIPQVDVGNKMDTSGYKAASGSSYETKNEGNISNDDEDDKEDGLENDSEIDNEKEEGIDKSIENAGEMDEASDSENHEELDGNDKADDDKSHESGSDSSEEKHNESEDNE